MYVQFLWNFKVKHYKTGILSWQIHISTMFTFNTYKVVLKSCQKFCRTKFGHALSEPCPTELFLCPNFKCLDPSDSLQHGDMLCKRPLQRKNPYTNWPVCSHCNNVATGDLTGCPPCLRHEDRSRWHNLVLRLDDRNNFVLLLPWSSGYLA